MSQVPSRTMLSSARSFRCANEPLIFRRSQWKTKWNLKCKTNFEFFDLIVPLLVANATKFDLAVSVSFLDDRQIVNYLSAKQQREIRGLIAHEGRALFAIRAKVNANNSRAGCTCW